MHPTINGRPPLIALPALQTVDLTVGRDLLVIRSPVPALRAAQRFAHWPAYVMAKHPDALPVHRDLVGHRELVKAAAAELLVAVAVRPDVVGLFLPLVVAGARLRSVGKVSCPGRYITDVISLPGFSSSHHTAGRGAKARVMSTTPRWMASRWKTRTSSEGRAPRSRWGAKTRSSAIIVSNV